MCVVMKYMHDMTHAVCQKFISVSKERDLFIFRVDYCVLTAMRMSNLPRKFLCFVDCASEYNLKQ